jgi:hypothetical protein
VKKDMKKEQQPHMAGKLRRAWNKSARRVRKSLCTVFAGATLALGTGCAHTMAQTAAPPPAPVVTAPARLDSAVQPAARDTAEARLDSIKAKMNRTETGRALLKFATDYKIPIRMSNSKEMDDKPDDAYIVKGLSSAKHILLNAEETNDDELMLTLAHELRHSWHRLVIKEGALNVDPTQMWVKDRILEADVFAFETHLAYEFEKTTGEKLNLSGFRLMPCFFEGSSLCLLSGYAADRDSGMAAGDAYARLVTRTFKTVRDKEYDAGFLDYQEEDWQGVIDNPVRGYRHFAGGMASDAEFATAMRRATTLGLTPGVGSSALDGWAEADFRSLEKTGGVTPEELARLEKLNGMFKDARAAWDAYWKNLIEGRLRPVSPRFNIVPLLPPAPPHLHDHGDGHGNRHGQSHRPSP